MPDTPERISEPDDVCFVPAPETIKALDTSDGTWGGYAAVFGNLDHGFDIIEKGAFKKFRHKKGGKMIRVMAYHDSRRIVGECSYLQDDRGLKVKGRLNMDLPDAPGMYQHLLDGGVDAMSVGFNILKDGSVWADDYSVRTISKCELWEVSLVPFGMNSKARVTSVKSGEIQSPADFEKLLRANGFTRKAALSITNQGFKAAQNDRDLDPEVAASVKSGLKNLRTLLDM